MRRFPRPALALVAALLVSAPLSCGSSEDVGPSSPLVGGRCSGDKDCSKRCLLGTRFPNGYCSQTCSTDKDCLDGTVCIQNDASAGVCMTTCRLPADCDPYGTGYSCNRGARQQGGEGALICTGGA